MARSTELNEKTTGAAFYTVLVNATTGKTDRRASTPQANILILLLK